MMNKEMLAKQINDKVEDISRLIKVDYLLHEELEEDQVIILEKAESYSDGGQFEVENDNEYTYLFKIINEVPVHRVDYDNEEEVYELGAEGCEEEKEVLVPAGAMLKVSWIGSELDMEEMGYITIELEFVGFQEEAAA